MRSQLMESCRKIRFLPRSVLVGSLMALSVLLSACTPSDNKPDVAPEKVTMAYSATTDAVLVVVAHVMGYFLQEGLDVTARPHPYGKLALEDVLAGKADFATVAETPVMFAIMNGNKISVIATIQNSTTGNAILARRDRGILTLGHLKGKRIAATLGTTSDFFLDAIVGVNGVTRKDLNVVDLKPEAMADALERGDLDAISTFTPYVAMAQKKLGHQVITFQDKDVYRWTFNIVAKQEFIRTNPRKVEKMLLALAKAEEFVRENPEEAQKIVADFCGIETGIVSGMWANTRFSATLDQSLILALEDESEWALKKGLVKAAKIPNYLEYIYFDGLNSVKPDSVRILR